MASHEFGIMQEAPVLGALDVPGKGLAYCGITLIPPASLPLMCDIIAAVPELADLHRMLIQAWKEDKYVIHYGL